MEARMDHFSHEHTLIFFHVDADEDPKPYRCRICGLPILSSPSYTCSVNANCNFFVHEPCTQLPEKFDHILHSETLHLEESTDESCRNFRYRCWNHSQCKFDVHPLVAKPVEIISQHKSHESHPLVAFCREIVSLCDGCGEEERGFFFHCFVCNFWIHQDCTILPMVVKLQSHPHPSILAYSLPYVPSHSSPEDPEKNCSICGKEWRLPKGGVYFCGECYSLAHVSCAKPNIENIISDTEILHLPDEEDTFPSNAIRRFVEKNRKDIQNENEKMITKYHQHPLVLEDACSSISHENVVCDVCVQPIKILPFYRCHDCHFLAHPMCADHLPNRFEIFSGPFRSEAVLNGGRLRYYFNSVFACSRCSRPSNGFSYNMRMSNGKSLISDVECTVAPRIVKHASHKQHLLFYTSRRWISLANCKFTCCPAESFVGGIYRCVVCDYTVHLVCALLPNTTRHKFDEHPLQLIMRHDVNNKVQEVFCEVCEQLIELKLWYYGCVGCEQYFHINCIPSVGFLSKVKFGKTLTDSRAHQHPLALTRMLTHGAHERCGICKEIIQGFSDEEMAFHCSPCNFWLHFSCAADTTRLWNYSEVLQMWFNSSK